MEDKIPREVRAWLYRIGAAVVPLLVFYGVLAEDAAALWLGVLGAVLGFGQATLASIHTPTRPSADRNASPEGIDPSARDNHPDTR